MVDIIANVLNGIMNAKRARKEQVVVKKHSKFLIKILEIAKKQGYILEYKTEGRNLKVNFNLNKCGVIKPRFYVKKDGMERYIRRFLPARNFGIIIISTNKGLITHIEAMEKNIGGSLIAYFF